MILLLFLTIGCGYQPIHSGKEIKYSINEIKTFGNQKHLFGPQIESEWEFSDFEYELSLTYLHGLTDASTNHMFLWNMELEF